MDAAVVLLALVDVLLAGVPSEAGPLAVAIETVNSITTRSSIAARHSRALVDIGPAMFIRKSGDAQAGEGAD